MISATDFATPPEMARDVAKDAAKKAGISPGHLAIRAFLCTPFLAYATCLCAFLVSQGWSPAAAGLMFPVGYVMLAMLGLEMVTGSFSVMGAGWIDGAVKSNKVLANWLITFFMNLVGGIFFAYLLWYAMTKGGNVASLPLLDVLCGIAEKKIAYNHYGLHGWLSAVCMGILCNWLVSVTPIISKASRSVPGKIMLMWLPIATFFSLGFEHSVVNMFVFPLAIFSGAEIGVLDWWLWNQIPVTLGNVAGALVFNVLMWYVTMTEASLNKSEEGL